MRGLRRSVVFVLLLAEAAHSQTGIRIGMTREEVVSQLGAPTGYFDAGTQMRTTTVPALVVGPLYDIYTRMSLDNEFEIRVNFSADFASSRLHPSLRVARAVVRFDKIISMKAAFALPEVQALCAQGCHLYAFRFKSPTFVPQSPEPIEAEVFDQPRSESILFKYFDAAGKEGNVSDNGGQVSELSIERFFDPIQPLIESKDLGVWRFGEPSLVTP